MVKNKKYFLYITRQQFGYDGYLMLDDSKWQMRSTLVYVVCLRVKVKVSHLKVRGRLSSGQKRLGSSWLYWSHT